MMMSEDDSNVDGGGSYFESYHGCVAAIVILWPQFTVHQGALGLSIVHTSIFSTVESAFNVFTPFLGGFVADKIGNYKVSPM